MGLAGKRHFCIVVETKKKGFPHESDHFCYSYNHFYFKNHKEGLMKIEIEEKEHGCWIAGVMKWWPKEVSRTWSPVAGL